MWSAGSQIFWETKGSSNLQGPATEPTEHSYGHNEREKPDGDSNHARFAHSGPLFSTLLVQRASNSLPLHPPISADASVSSCAPRSRFANTIAPVLVASLASTAWAANPKAIFGALH